MHWCNNLDNIYGNQQNSRKKRYKMIITVTEIIINVLFFYVWIIYKSTFQMLYCIMLLVPVIIAIAFSGKSYINKIFKHNFFKHCNTISLMFYLNQMVPTAIVTVFVKDNLPLGITIAFSLTAIFSLINMFAVKILKAIGKKIVSET